MAIRTLTPNDPAGWVLRAQSFYEKKRYSEAAETLQPALAKFPDSFHVQYDAACYACLLGGVPRAKVQLEKAFAIDGSPEMKMQSLNDPDFERLWRDAAA